MGTAIGSVLSANLYAQAGDPITAFGLSANGRRFLVNGKGTFLAGFREGYVGGDWNSVYCQDLNGACQLIYRFRITKQE